MVAVSVIVPVYKCEENIATCIESILNQSMGEFKLILVDDGSPDRAPKICDTYAKKDSRIVVIHKENGGVSSARNDGIAVSEGEYITFVDSDDYLAENFLKDLLAAAKQYQADLVVSGVIMETWSKEKCEKKQIYSFAEDKHYNSRTLLEQWGIDFPPICICGPCCKLYRRDVLMRDNIRFLQDLDCGEDTYFNMEYLERISRIWATSQCYYHYRRGNEESLFSRFHLDTYEIHHRVYGKMRHVMEKVECSQTAKNNFENAYFELLVGGIHEYFRFYDKTNCVQKRELLEKIAKDPYVKKLKENQIAVKKNRILHRLLKMELYGVVLAIFRIYYRKK